MNTGRYIELRMLPLSFSEYCEGNKDNISVNQKHLNYLENSSFPYALQYGDDKIAIKGYLQGLYNTVILKDVIARYNISDVMMLERELNSLQKINDHYPKYILTLDEDPIADYNGIKRINALDWMLHKIIY